ncbi:hypothetical protein [Enorma phocaeensis]|uniref:hypothetical protein n=1 Tax=Enorma phocaeensis TaxID=1871019 RepID=UPI001EF73D88|nr:hypothetical protein [Enorma phocaeensis]
MRHGGAHAKTLAHAEEDVERHHELRRQNVGEQQVQNAGLDQAIPGFASAETLLYAPELKFYSNRVRMDERFTTNVAGLHCLGDSSGWTRGLMMASVMGHLMGGYLAEEL